MATHATPHWTQSEFHLQIGHIQYVSTLLVADWKFEPLPHILYVVNSKCEPQVRYLLMGEGGRAGWFAKRCHSLTDHRINCKLKTKIANTILLLCYKTRFVYLLLVAFGKLWRIYIVKRGYKREPEPVACPQLTTLHSTINTSVKKEVGHSNTPGTIRLCSFPLKYCCT